MEGRVISHYHILEKLGGGGMGVVYRAQDTKLKRTVALKFLSPDLTRDEDAKRRFMQEAQAASSLDHPNICTIYEIDETSEGQLFLAMAFYEGETLSRRIARGPLPVDEALDIAMQVAQGLAKAHEARIIHRDIKPANLILSKEGVVKILDFGIAKLVGQTGVTETGMRVGTVAYMAPEQLKGVDVDVRADLWALGVVLHEMVTGGRPFRGDHELAVLNAILNAAPIRMGDTPGGVPERLERIVARALEKDRQVRYSSAADLRRDLTDLRAALTAPPRVPTLQLAPMSRVLLRPSVAVPVLVILAAVGAALAWMWTGNRDVTRAQQELIPEIRRLAGASDLVAAVTLAQQVERIIPQEPALAGLWPVISRTVSFETTPSDAEIRYRSYADANAAWVSLGRSPLQQVRMPQGVFRVEVRADGVDTLETITVVGPGGALTVRYALSPKGAAPPGMVPVAGGPLDLGFIVLRGAFEPVTAPGYLIDRYEVTNEAFKTFVDAGGYRAADMSGFRDATGRPGPATWNVGTFPAGQGNYPVSGVSWYEANAYCQFAGKTLPTIYHWGSAASIDRAGFVAPLSNFASNGPMPVGTSQGISRVGAYDMAGNVREWVLNASGRDRYIVGGAWEDPSYKFYEPELRSPSDRSPSNGFRCAQFEPGQPVPEALKRDMPLPVRDYAREQPVSDEVFEAYKAQYLYDARDLGAVVESIDDSSRYWRKEKISFQAAYGGARMLAYLFLPKTGTPPYQTVLWWPGPVGMDGVSASDSIVPPDYMLLSGRAVLRPVFDGTYERNRGELVSAYFREGRLYRDYAVRWIQDAMRSIDYAVTRSDVDKSRVALLGSSWGGQNAPVLATVDGRLAAIVIHYAGLPMQRALPEIDGINFVGRVRTPTLIIGGEYDYVYPLDTSQRPLFNLLGTRADDKRHVVFKAMGHGFLQGGILAGGVSSGVQNDAVRETLGWLEKYLGPVKG